MDKRRPRFFFLRFLFPELGPNFSPEGIEDGLKRPVHLLGGQRSVEGLEANMVSQGALVRGNVLPIIYIEKLDSGNQALLRNNLLDSGRRHVPIHKDR